MKLLLDTCVFIWLTQEPARISSEASHALNDPANELLLSHARIWEIYLKHDAAKLQLPESPRDWILKQLKVRGVIGWPIDLESLHRTTELPVIHKDSFDRLIIAQAQTHGLIIVSLDLLIQKYSVQNLC